MLTRAPTLAQKDGLSQREKDRLFCLGRPVDQGLQLTGKAATDEQPKPHTQSRAAKRGVGPVKALEQPLRLLLGHSHARITDGDAKHVRGSAEPDGNRAAPGRILDGIVDQVCQHLLDPNGIRGHLARGGTARETRFYADVADRAGLRAPQCYYGAIDEASGRSVLLLEDLTALRPAARRQPRRMQPGGRDARSRQLARFHARWWEQPDLARFAWMPALFEDPVAAQDLYQASWRPFLAAWGHLVPERAQATGEWFALHGATVWEQIAAPPHTFMHGDFRLDNLLFDAADAQEPLAVVDWQAVRLGKGVGDLAYFATSSLQPNHRREWERQLVDSYHATLVEHGVRGYDLARCFADYRLARFWNLHTVVVVGPLFDFSHPRAEALLVAAIERLVALLDDHVQALPPTS